MRRSQRRRFMALTIQCKSSSAHSSASSALRLGFEDALFILLYEPPRCSGSQVVVIHRSGCDKPRKCQSCCQSVFHVPARPRARLNGVCHQGVRRRALGPYLEIVFDRG